MSTGEQHSNKHDFAHIIAADADRRFFNLRRVGEANHAESNYVYEANVERFFAINCRNEDAGDGR